MDSNTPDNSIDLDLMDADEKEQAFVEWVRSGQSTRAVAENLGISQRTVQDWVTRYRWRSRLAQMLEPVTAEALAEVRLAYAIGMRTALRRLLTDLDRDDLSPRDVRDHATLIARLAEGHSPQAEQATSFIDARQVHITPDSLSPEEARVLSVRAIEGNVEQAKVKKVGRRGYQ